MAMSTPVMPLRPKPSMEARKVVSTESSRLGPFSSAAATTRPGPGRM